MFLIAAGFQPDMIQVFMALPTSIKSHILSWQTYTNFCSGHNSISTVIRGDTHVHNGRASHSHTAPGQPLQRQQLPSSNVNMEPLWLVDSPHKRPVTRKMFPFDDVIMNLLALNHQMSHIGSCDIISHRLGPLLLTWINFNPSMAMWSHWGVVDQRQLDYCLKSHPVTSKGSYETKAGNDSGFSVNQCHYHRFDKLDSTLGDTSQHTLKLNAVFPMLMAMMMMLMLMLMLLLLLMMMMMTMMMLLPEPILQYLDLGNKAQWNLKQNSYIFIKNYAFEDAVRKMAALSRPQRVNVIDSAA